MEESVAERLKHAELKKEELMRSLDALKAQSSSLLEVSVRWRDVDSYFDSTFELIRKKSKEAVSAIRAREVAAEKRAEEMRVKEERFRVLRNGIFGEIFKKRARLVEMEREIEERTMRMEDERMRLEKEISDRRNAMEWRVKRLDQRKKVLDALVKEVEVRELQIEEERKAVERRSAELDLKEKELYEMKRAMDDVSEELEMNRNENNALRDDVPLLTQKLDFTTKSSNSSGKSGDEESPGTAEQLSSNAECPQVPKFAGIVKDDCSSTLNAADVHEAGCQFSSNAAETCSTENANHLSCGCESCRGRY